MKVTYSNSYDRSAGYAADIQVDAKSLQVSLYYEASSVADHGLNNPVDGGTVNTAWAGKLVVPYTTMVLSLDEVKREPSWSDRSIWTGTGRFLPDLLLPVAKHTKLWHNITAETFNSKVRPTNHFMRQMRTSPMDMGAFLLYVPFKESDFEECALHVLSKIEGIPHLVNGTPITDPETDPMLAQLSVMPRLQIFGSDTIHAGDYSWLNLVLVDSEGKLIQRDTDVYLKATSGYLPKTKVTLMQGKGVLKVLALELDVGDSITVKAGFKFWSNDVEHTLEVQ